MQRNREWVREWNHYVERMHRIISKEQQYDGRLSRRSNERTNDPDDKILPAQRANNTVPPWSHISFIAVCWAMRSVPTRPKVNP